MTKGKVRISSVSKTDEAGWVRITIYYDDRILRADIDFDAFAMAIVGNGEFAADITTFVREG